jgi:hypothetical protein
LPADPTRTPTSTDLKAPILWLAQAKALSEAAKAVFERNPTWEELPAITRGMADSQFRAVGLMLLGYSLEVALKAMHIVSGGIDGYQLSERDFKHHRLHDLSALVPHLSEKDAAILKLLTEFMYWAGRYPDPGSGRESLSDGIFKLSEQFQISAKDLFELMARVMQHVQNAVSSEKSAT